MAGSEDYVSVDIEADGPVPGLHSMLSLGAVAHDSNALTDISHFSGKLKCSQRSSLTFELRQQDFEHLGESWRQFRNKRKTKD